VNGLEVVEEERKRLSGVMIQMTIGVPYPEAHNQRVKGSITARVWRKATHRDVWTQGMRWS